MSCIHKITALLILAVATGCATTYKVQVDGNTFESRSYREFKRIEFEYKDLHFKASGVTDDTAEAATAIFRELGETGKWVLQFDPSQE